MLALAATMTVLLERITFSKNHYFSLFGLKEKHMATRLQR
jgi:hypothetical protein